MIATLISLMFTVLLQQPATTDLPVLRPGDAIEGTIEETDPVIHTEVLDAGYSEAPVRGKTFRIERTQPGPLFIELRSHFFDAYLVLRDETGAPILEDDDGLVSTHSRIVVRGGLSQHLRVDVCALHGGSGRFVVAVVEGKPDALSPEQLRESILEDAREILEEREQSLGPEHPDTATSLNTLAVLYWSQGALEKARPLYERALRIRESVLGPDHPVTAESLNNLALLLRSQGAYKEARPMYERALQIHESVLGPDHPSTATSLNNLAGLLTDQGAYEDARPLHERALRIRESAFGPVHPDTAESLNNLALLLRSQGAYEEARMLHERALRIRESALGPNHTLTATSLNNLALLLKDQGAYEEARPLFERALQIHEAALGPNHTSTATSLNNLALLLRDQGAYEEARPLFERSRRIVEEALGQNHPDTAASLNNLALLLKSQGTYDEARPLFERALRIRESAFGPKHPVTAMSLDSLAGLFWSKGAYERARPLLERALQIYEAALGPEHPLTASGLNNLAVVLQNQGAYQEARPLFERALRITEAALGPNHTSTATSLNNLALLLQNQGAYQEARHLFERALRIKEAARGPDHPDTAESLNNLARLEFDLGELASASHRSRYALLSAKLHVENVLWSMSEAERLRFIRLKRGTLDLMLSMSGAKESVSSIRTAYDAVLGWKGQVGRGLIRGRESSLRSLPEAERTLVNQLRSSRRQMSDLLYATEIGNPAAHADRLRKLRAEKNRIEVELARLRGKRKIEKQRDQRDDIEVLKDVVPDDSATIDFLEHHWWEPARWDDGEFVRAGRWTTVHLSAWVVRDGELQQFDLGEADVVAKAVREYLQELVQRRGAAAVTETDSNERSAANDRLRELLWDPLAEAVGDATTIYLSGDTFLGTLPFETLRREDGSYLLEHHAFTYLSDLQSLPDALTEKKPSEPRLFAAGGIDYRKRADLPDGEQSTAHSDTRASLSRLWRPLEWTGAETSAIAEIHSLAAGDSATQLVVSGSDATEERIKNALSGFTHVHLATHGYFHPEGLPSAWRNLGKHDDEKGLMTLRDAERHVVGYHPGLLSGLVFAGANAKPESGRDNGLLTAEEISFLDLSDCDLVVLSACETGLGRPEAGEGMLGLRRAFRMAGARTVISSLWEVSDASTRELMTLFYENLWLREMPKGEALRAAQRTMLEHNRETYGDARPSTWGSFVLDGAPE